MRFGLAIVATIALTACQSAPATSLYMQPGVVGATGDTGPVGVAGPHGTVGATGPQGTTGPTGVQGVAGPSGPAGATGSQVVIGAPVVSMHNILPTTIQCGVSGDPASTVLASASIPDPTTSGAIFVSYQIVSSDGANYQTRLTYDVNDTPTLLQQGHSALSMGSGSGVIQMNQFAGTYPRGGSLTLHQDCAAGLQDTHTVTGNMVVMYWAN